MPEPPRNRWQQLSHLYHAALQLHEDDRLAFLRRECGADDALRVEVELLLNEGASGNGFMEYPSLELHQKTVAQPEFRTLIGQHVGPYQIQTLLGAGGMGEVYRARDTRLHRDVAMKMLPREFTADRYRLAWFEREARVLAALNHPNICAIYGLEEVPTEDGVGVRALVLELVDGPTLAERIAGPELSIDEIFKITRQVIDALEVAHEKGIVHRDLKPANIKIASNGVLKVLDFGLARRINKTSDEDITQSQISLAPSGALIGTLPYMAPELLRGQQADSRSDIWALGVTLYEMVMRELPFQGQTAFELSSAIFNQPLRAVPENVPSQLRQVLEQCLQKQPEKRYSNVGAIRSALDAAHNGPIAGRRSRPVRRTGSRTGRPKVRALAVLPLANTSADTEQEYFADGMTDALVSDLAKIEGLRVISRTSAMKYKGTTKTLPEIAEELGVDAVVEGSVFRVGNRVRITAQLIHAATDTHIWAESYERDMQDILQLQGEVAQAVSRSIHLALTPEQIKRMMGRRLNTQAYEAYLKGRFWESKRTKDAFTKANEYFHAAIESDPRYALAYVGVADGYAMSEAWGLMSPQDAFPKSKQAVLKALEIDGSLAEAHTTLGWIQYATSPEWLNAEAEFLKAFELNSNYATAHQWYGLFLLSAGRLAEGEREIRRALECDPLSLVINVCLGIALFYSRRYKDAVEQFRKTIEMDPYWFTAHEWLGLVYLADSKPAEAIFQFEKAIELSHWFNLQGGWLGYALAVAGRKDEAHRALEQLNAIAETNYVPEMAKAAIHAGLGESEQAVELLQKACERSSSAVKVFSLNIAPMWDPLRVDSRFQTLLHNMRFPPV